MLVWAQQGLSLKETADKMNVANKTIENIRRTLFEKLGVNTIEQAIQYASNRRLIYHSPPVHSKTAPKAIKQRKQKR
ncbi:MAG: helix-turn-helix transcriptional regulator [Tannerella sp.]|nr:helix-turn-helix transcriptional regulator [Tannerella sp.]